MVRTLNLMFSSVETRLEKLNKLMPGNPNRTVELEKLAKDVPLLIAMMADLAVELEDLKHPPTTTTNIITTDTEEFDVAVRDAVNNTGQYL